MLIGTLKNVSFFYGEVVILDSLTVDLPEGACIAVVGANGAGKSTLLSILAREMEPMVGKIAWYGKVPTIAYFKQEMRDEGTIDWTRDELQIHRSRLMIPERAEYASASGGERIKMRLSAALAEKSDILLLDEPTNHLDSNSLEELIEILDKDQRTIVMVSHDRYFIDRTADFIFEIEYGKLSVYKGNYSAYREKKEVERVVQLKQYEQQQSKIAHVEEQLAELGDWSAKAHAESAKKGGRAIGAKEYFRMKAKKRDVQIKSKRKRLEAELEKGRIDKPTEKIDVSFEVKGYKKKGIRVLELKDVGKSFGSHKLFKDVSFTIQAGERIALIGPNGSGKTTLFKMILNTETHEGELWKTKGMKIGYLSQMMLDLPEEQTIAMYFHADTYQEQGVIRTQLTNLGFTEEHWNLPLAALSQGERVKVKLMQFIVGGMDVLLLDEPTNHLDLPSREELERTLQTFPGTIVFASHDRYFTERMARGLLIFGNETIRKIPMTIQEWEERAIPKQQEIASSEERLRLETELQAVLGKLSLLKKGDVEYARLDTLFKEVSRRLRELG